MAYRAVGSARRRRCGTSAGSTGGDGSTAVDRDANFAGPEAADALGRAAAHRVRRRRQQCQDPSRKLAIRSRRCTRIISPGRRVEPVPRAVAPIADAPAASQDGHRRGTARYAGSTTTAAEQSRTSPGARPRTQHRLLVRSRRPNVRPRWPASPVLSKPRRIYAAPARSGVAPSRRGVLIADHRLEHYFPGIVPVPVGCSRDGSTAKMLGGAR